MPTGDPSLVEWGRELLKRPSGREAECLTLANAIEQYAQTLDKPARTVVVPTHEFDRDPDILQAMGQASADVLYPAFADGLPHTVLVSFGLQVRAEASAFGQLKRGRRIHNEQLLFVPASGAYPRHESFNSERLCETFAGNLGGEAWDLSLEGFVAYKGKPTFEQELIAHFREGRSYERVFGSRGLAWRADTAICGMGAAMTGDSLIDFEGRFQDRRQLRQGDYQVVADLNTQFPLVRRDGEEVVIPSYDLQQPDLRNRTAWDANQRAVGAGLHLYAHIAEQHREHQRRSERPPGGGVIVTARHENLAAGAYAMLRAGLVNTLVLSYQCAKKLKKLLDGPKEQVLASVPPITQD